jgi:hypothetical protein
MCKLLSTIVIDHAQTPSQVPGYAEVVKNFKFISDESQITDDVPMAVVVWDNYDFIRRMALLRRAMEKGTWVTLVTFGTGFNPSRKTWWDKNASLVVSIDADGSIDFDAEGERYALSPDGVNKQLTYGFKPNSAEERKDTSMRITDPTLVKDYLIFAYRDCIHKNTVKNKHEYLMRVFMPKLPVLQDIGQLTRFTDGYINVLEQVVARSLTSFDVDYLPTMMLSSSIEIIQELKESVLSNHDYTLYLNWENYDLPMLLHPEEYISHESTRNESLRTLFAKEASFTLNQATSKQFLQAIVDFYKEV